jgi:DNA-binding MarR family transcriptional regulator
MRTTLPAAQPRPAASPASPARVAEQLMDVAPLVTRWIRGEMRRASAGSLTVPQLRAIHFVRRNPGTHLSPLAEHLGVGVTTASGLVDRLVRQELLTRSQDPQERRRVRLEVTRAGESRVTRSRGHTSSALAEALSSLSGEELAVIQQALLLVRQSVQPGRTPEPA